MKGYKKYPMNMIQPKGASYKQRKVLNYSSIPRIT